MYSRSMTASLTYFRAVDGDHVFPGPEGHLACTSFRHGVVAVETGRP
jgi:hypothetical protein